MTTNHYILGALSPDHGARLLRLGHEVTFPRSSVVFHQEDQADRFWIIRTGYVALDLQVPGLRTPVFETVGPVELLGWSWMFEPHRWSFGAQTLGPVEAYEFEAAAVRSAWREDRDFGFALLEQVAATIANRLTSARGRLLTLYGSLAAPALKGDRPAPARTPTEVAEEQRPSSMVGDVMTRAVVTVDRSAPFKEVVQTLQRWGVSALPVIEGTGAWRG